MGSVGYRGWFFSQSQLTSCRRRQGRGRERASDEMRTQQAASTGRDGPTTGRG